MSSLPPGDRPGLTHGLSVRESDVVTLIAAGYSNREIAETLFLSVNSVKTYIRCAYHKMGVTRRSQAVLWAVDHGFTHRMGSPSIGPQQVVLGRPEPSAVRLPAAVP